jgi:hypothetical protein
MKPIRRVAALAALALAVAAGTALTGSVPRADATSAHTPAAMIEKITGPGAINDTAGRWDIKSTDLGIMWDNGSGQVLTAFGDTFGATWTGPGGSGGSNWRSNVLVRSSDTNLADGMWFSSAATAPNGLAKELIPSQKIDNVEITVIPTAGISVGSRQYLGFMSVRHWGVPGQWDTNRAGIAYSDDNGQNWSTAGTPTWENVGGTNRFQMQSYVKRDGYVYVHATPNGRLGAVYVARVPEAQLLTKSAYQYWNGSAWTATESAAVAVVGAPAGELSVQYNAASGRYLMMYLAGEDIVLRTATAPQGPWSAAQVIVSSADYPGLYGGYLHPWNSGGSLYFALSQWNPYNVYLMRVSIDANGIVTKPNLLGDPSFERAAMGSGTGGFWACSPNCGIDTAAAGGYSGDRNAYTRYNSGWRNVWQRVTVQANTTYVLSGYLRTSLNSDNGFMGARTTAGSILSEVNYGAINGWRRYTVTFNSGSNTSVDVYAGVWTNNGDIWIQLDDFSLVKQ